MTPVTGTRRYPPINLGSPGEDISTRDLHSIVQRFKNLNQLRLNRVKEFLQHRQQIFLQLLPLLFHQNHPLLPGYISSETPAGIPDYRPTHQAIQAAKQFSKGFIYKRRALLDYPIQSIFLMGSVSSIAFSKTSDMDIWLCHKTDLLELDIAELQEKATKIEDWAASFHLEVHFFLIDSEQFTQGQHVPMSVESSGNTQHYILLEEFYRTSIYIAGKIPAWWLVPPDQEYNYSSYIRHLVEHRFVSKNEIIDFGGLESIPAEEFITATLWHIYKSINSPHKSLLKLFLMESYASEYPKPQWLCFDLKHEIYQGTFNVDQLDPYLLIYSKVEKYLSEAQSIHRLNLARECFYLKIMGPSSKSLDYQSRLFRENYMQNISDQWCWPEILLLSLHKHKFWDIKKATHEHSVIRSELKHCLRMIMALAGEYAHHSYRDNHDLKLISRKLHVFLEKKPGKIEIITTRSNVNIKENELSIIESNQRNSSSPWTLYSGKFDHHKAAKNALIKQEHSLLGLLGWLIINGLYQKQLLLHFESSSLDITDVDIHKILAQLAEFLSQNLKTDSSLVSIYSKPNKLLSSLIFINLGLTQPDERTDGMMIMSERSDPLSYGLNQQCFIQKVDHISVSSWGEVITSHYIGLDAFFSCLTQIFNDSQQPVNAENLKIACYTPVRAKSISLRVQSIFNNLIDFFSDQSNQQNTRYLLPGGQAYYIFQNKNKRLHYWSLDSTEQLTQELATAQDTFSAVHFDPVILENTIIPYLYCLNLKQIIQIFYICENDSTNIYIIDENGALFFQEHNFSNYQHVLNNYSSFLESILNQPFYNNDVQIKHYKIQRDKQGIFSSHSIKNVPSISYDDLALRVVIVDALPNSSDVAYYVYCNEQEFSSEIYGKNLFKEISKYFLQCRQNTDDYSIHISDLDAPYSYFDVENESQLQTIHFLKMKQKIENKINHFL